MSVLGVRLLNYEMTFTSPDLHFWSKNSSNYKIKLTNLEVYFFLNQNNANSITH